MSEPSELQCREPHPRQKNSSNSWHSWIIGRKWMSFRKGVLAKAILDSGSVKWFKGWNIGPLSKCIKDSKYIKTYQNHNYIKVDKVKQQSDSLWNLRWTKSDTRNQKQRQTSPLTTHQTHQVWKGSAILSLGTSWDWSVLIALPANTSKYPRSKSKQGERGGSLDLEPWHRNRVMFCHLREWHSRALLDSQQQNAAIMLVSWRLCSNSILSHALFWMFCFYGQQISPDIQSVLAIGDCTNTSIQWDADIRVEPRPTSVAAARNSHASYAQKSPWTMKSNETQQMISTNVNHKIWHQDRLKKNCRTTKRTTHLQQEC